MDWDDRQKYLSQTQRTIRTLTRSMDAAQVGDELPIEVHERLQEQEQARSAYDKARA